MARQLLAAAAAPGVSPGPPTRPQALTSQWPARGGGGRARPGRRAPRAGESPRRGSSGPARVGRRQDAAPGRGPVGREQGARRRRGGPQALQPPRRAHLCCPRHRALRRRRPATPPLPPSPALRPRPGPISPNPEKKVLRRRAHPATTAWHGSPEGPAALEQPPPPAPAPRPPGAGPTRGKRTVGRAAPSRRLCDRAVRQPLAPARLCRALRQLGDAGHGGLAASEERSSSSALPRLCWPQLSALPRARRGAQGCGVGPGKRGSCRGRVGRADRQWRLTQGHLWAPHPFVPGCGISRAFPEQVPRPTRGWGRGEWAVSRARGPRPRSPQVSCVNRLGVVEPRVSLPPGDC